METVRRHAVSAHWSGSLRKVIDDRPCRRNCAVMEIPWPVRRPSTASKAISALVEGVAVGYGLCMPQAAKDMPMVSGLDGVCSRAPVPSFARSLAARSDGRKANDFGAVSCCTLSEHRVAFMHDERASNGACTDSRSWGLNPRKPPGVGIQSRRATSIVQSQLS